MIRRPPRSTPFPTRRSSDLKILVVEDDRATRKALKQLFEPEGYSVELAENGADGLANFRLRSEEHTSELQSHSDLVCRLLLEKKKKKKYYTHIHRKTNETFY